CHAARAALVPGEQDTLAGRGGVGQLEHPIMAEPGNLLLSRADDQSPAVGGEGNCAGGTDRLQQDVRQRLARGGVPHAQLEPASAGDVLSFGAECHTANRAALLLVAVQLLTSDGVPETHRAVVASRGDSLAVRRERYPPDGRRVTPQGE